MGALDLSSSNPIYLSSLHATQSETIYEVSIQQRGAKRKASDLDQGEIAHSKKQRITAQQLTIGSQPGGKTSPATKPLGTDGHLQGNNQIRDEQALASPSSVGGVGNNIIYPMYASCTTRSNSTSTVCDNVETANTSAEALNISFANELQWQPKRTIKVKERARRRRREAERSTQRRRDYINRKLVAVVRKRAALQGEKASAEMEVEERQKFITFTDTEVQRLDEEGELLLMEKEQLLAIERRAKETEYEMKSIRQRDKERRRQQQRQQRGVCRARYKARRSRRPLADCYRPDYHSWIGHGTFWQHAKDPEYEDHYHRPNLHRRCRRSPGKYDNQKAAKCRKR